MVTGHSWHVDIQTLKEININYVNKVPVYASQLKMLTAGRVVFSMFEAIYLDEKKTPSRKTTLRKP